MQASTGGDCEFGNFRLDDSDHPVYILLRLRRRYSGLQPRDCSVVKVVGFRTLLYRSKAHGNPQIPLSPPSQTHRSLKILRHHADNRVRPAVKIDCLAQYMRIALESLLPQRIADDRHWRRRVIFLLREGTSYDRVDPQHWKHRCGQPLRPRLEGSART